MAKKRNAILDFFAWIALVVIVLYFLLKLLGVINSPVTIDLFALLSAAYFVGRYANKIDNLFNDISSIKQDIKKLDGKCPVFEKERAKTK